MSTNHCNRDRSGNPGARNGQAKARGIVTDSPTRALALAWARGLPEYYAVHCCKSMKFRNFAP